MQAIYQPDTDTERHEAGTVSSCEKLAAELYPTFRWFKSS